MEDVGSPTRYQALVSAAAALGVKIVQAEPMARHTTFRIGGPAELYATVSEPEALEALAQLAWQDEVPVTILGGGSNILVSDAGIRGLVIANGYRTIRMAGSTGDDDQAVAANATSGQVVAGSGAPLAGLARWAIREGRSGLEWAVSVPGTVGGAVIGNAGAHGSDIAGNLAWVLVAFPGGARRVLQPADLGFAYRSTRFKEQIAQAGSHTEERRNLPVILEAGFNVKTGDVDKMTATAEGYLARRRASQPVEPSAGSVFRNPPGDYAGRLIEAVGLKGYQIGGAQISLRHANFIINRGGAHASDVHRLVELARSQVRESYGVDLFPEILFVGEWGTE